MIKDSLTERVTRLAADIERYQTSYYNGYAEISDSEFDALWDELKALAPDHPLLSRIGADSLDGFAKARHLMPMGSQEKAATVEAFLSWVAKTAPKAFVVQYKLDGASLELQYRAGLLVRAVTRGDGAIGDDITANARRIGGCLSELDLPFSGGVRGEVLMTRQVKAEKYPDAANCRNAANGVMRRKDGLGAEDLVLVCYDVMDADASAAFATETEKIDWLTKRGFNVTPSSIFRDAESVVAYRAEVSEKRPGLPYDIDGLVVKDVANDPADLRRARPERQIAFKFDLEEAITLLRAVEWSESGATYTPIGIVDPVQLAGTTVQRANLNNPAMIKAMGLRLGARVVVVKRGEIIPKIERLADGETPAAPEATAIVQPMVCGSCGMALTDAGTRLYCPNPACPKRIHHRLEKWISVLDIRDFGERLLRRLFDAGRLKRIADLYTLRVEEMAAVDRMGDISAAKVIKKIKTPRRLSLAAFIAGFDFEGIGETIMDKVAAAGFDTLEKLRGASVEGLAAIHGIGEISAKTIIDGLAETSDDMDAVLAAGFVSIAPPPSPESAPLRSLSFCFTGELRSIKRSRAAELVKSLGAIVKDSITKDLSYLVTNDPLSGSAKNEKAKKLGVSILDEAAFLSLLKRPSAPLNNTSAQTERGVAQGELF